MEQNVWRAKIRGGLWGSAIGDAWGTPIEMWSHEEIHQRFGSVSTLLPSQREIHPEGPWISPGPVGTLSDDTRWKALCIDALSASGSQMSQAQWAAYILAVYEGKRTFAPHTRVSAEVWLASLAEWADAAQQALRREGNTPHRFYGGEMTCAGMLFTPLIGLLHPGAPEQAYVHAYELDFVDLGYARDLAALLAAFVAAACVGQTDWPELIQTIDPMGYANRRLVERHAFRRLKIAQTIVLQCRLASGWQDQAMSATAQLQHYLAFYPFDPGEIFLLVLTAMLLFENDFERSLHFLINFGRDNDTTAAIAGCILGSLHGDTALPSALLEPVLAAGPQQGMDFEGMEQRLAAILGS